MTPMVALLIVMGYLFVGISISIAAMIITWNSGEDILGKHLGYLCIAAILWPLALAIMAYEKWQESQKQKGPFSERVLIKGKLSAKVEKALKE